MFTEIKNGKRCCQYPSLYITPWDYLKAVLNESGFVDQQKASSREYIVKGCDNKILIYVKFNTEEMCKIVFVTECGENQSCDIYWEHRGNFHENGDFVLFNIRQIWSSLTTLDE
jgi:hypothetical protein